MGEMGLRKLCSTESLLCNFNTSMEEADLLDYESLCKVIKGCQGVFHTASPVTDDPEQMVEPAVNGTKFVIDSAAEAGVCRVVCTSSIGAVTLDPNRGPDVVVDESCWSDLDFCKMTKLELVLLWQSSGPASSMGDGKREKSRFGGGSITSTNRQC